VRALRHDGDVSRAQPLVRRNGRSSARRGRSYVRRAGCHFAVPPGPFNGRVGVRARQRRSCRASRRPRPPSGA